MAMNVGMCHFFKTSDNANIYFLKSLLGDSKQKQQDNIKNTLLRGTAVIIIIFLKWAA